MSLIETAVFVHAIEEDTFFMFPNDQQVLARTGLVFDKERFVWEPIISPDEKKKRMLHEIWVDTKLKWYTEFEELPDRFQAAVYAKVLSE